MATVTRQFKEDFDTWAADRIASGQFTQSEMEEMKGLLRIDFAPGPDQLRAGYSFLNEKGITIPATIDDHEERYRVWSDYFAAEANIIRGTDRKAA